MPKGRPRKASSPEERHRQVLDEARQLIIEGLAGRPEPINWLESNIDLSRLIACPANGKLSFNYTPYTRDVIRSIFGDGRLQISVCAPSQTTKSSIIMFSELYILANLATTSLIVYQSDSVASETNEKLVQLMQGIPKLARELERSFSYTADAFRFSDSICNFQGAGSPISTRPAEYVFLDEINLWGFNAGGNSNVLQAMKRGTQYANAKVVSVCTPTDEGDENKYKIYGLWKSGSQGVYHLRCQKCRKLSMDTRAIKNLQWELDDHNKVKPDSIVLVCPVCGHWHKESDRNKLIDQGGYIHGDMSMYNKHRTFTWGALASKAPAHEWAAIADAQLGAGRSADPDAQQDFDNNFRGLPLQIRNMLEVDGEAWNKLKEDLPKKEDMLGLFLGADSQDDVYKWVIVGLDKQWTLHVIEAGVAPDIPALDDIYRKTYLDGMTIKAGIVDSKGHRFVESRAYAKTRAGMWLYSGWGYGSSGAGKQQLKWQISVNDPNEIRAAALLYQRDLLYRIHVNTNAATHRLRFFNKILPTCIEECANIRPNNKVVPPTKL